jgi:hypothetical protein
MPGRHLPPNPAAGDESTLGGYMAVHSRPAAFEGPDGLAYSVDVMVDETGDKDRPYGAYLIFMQWRRVGEPGIGGHLESDYLAFANAPGAARRAIGAMSLGDVKGRLDALVRARGGQWQRKWHDAMRDER